MLGKRRISLTIALLALGILLSIQYQTQQAALKDLANQKQEDLVKVLSNLVEKKANLTNELWNLRLQKGTFANSASQGQQVAEAMKKDLNRLQMFYGAAAIHGPGIMITIPEQTNTITCQELLAMLNELWNIGAEGIAVNGIRITSYTPIEEDPETLETMVDGQRLELPYYISAIGDPEKLGTNMAFAGGTIEQLRSYDSMIINIDQKQDLVLPIAHQPTDFHYAQVVQDDATPAAVPTTK